AFYARRYEDAAKFSPYFPVFLDGNWLDVLFFDKDKALMTAKENLDQSTQVYSERFKINATLLMSRIQKQVKSSIKNSITRVMSIETKPKWF
ncbi:MAG: hypothetical protein II046_10815, partial [Clostridiales bacterium]|nr:hypothetical protein [Clostridiales bacterium]